MPYADPQRRKDARREWITEARRRFRAGELEVAHGTRGAYSIGCRCNPCMAANSAGERARYEQPGVAQRNMAYTKAWRRRVQADPAKAKTLWTGAEMSVATERTSDGKYVRTAPEVAQVLGRSITAVVRLRQKCLRDPRYRRAAGE